ncbi:MAG: hypothetical protein NT121_03160 [Chloroflexi bacterium]|nr:hypothetical protein [Chloroflexota bacterium]
MTTDAPNIEDQVLSLAAAELRRLESENDTWHGAYSGMHLVDGDTTVNRIGVIYNLHHSIARSFPKGLWIVYLKHSIPRTDGKNTIMAFSKKDLALVYFGTANDEG